MKTTDILGQALPVLTVGGVSVLPPPLFAVRAHLPHLIGFIRKVIIRDLDKQSFDALTPHLQALWAGVDPDAFDAEELLFAVSEYIIFIRETIPVMPCCALPNVTDDEESDGCCYELFTVSEKLVADYARLPLTAVLRLNYVDFLILRREAFIYNLSKTKNGREKLADAYCMEQTEPDRGRLRAQFGGEEHGR